MIAQITAITTDDTDSFLMILGGGLVNDDLLDRSCFLEREKAPRPGGKLHPASRSRSDSIALNEPDHLLPEDRSSRRTHRRRRSLPCRQADYQPCC